MNPDRFLDIVRELMDENPFAIRALLRILGVEFTEAVPTLAVTNEARPRLLVNLSFVCKHCLTDEEVKAVVCHEFLHVLLRHTEHLGPVSPTRHLAIDAIINAIIHRQMGARASEMMARYYKDASPPVVLLRPPTDEERNKCNRASAPQLARAWLKLYDGCLVADDIEQLAKDIPGNLALEAALLGNHAEGTDEPLEDTLAGALEDALKQMNGAGIWRSPRRAVSAIDYEALFPAREQVVARWKRTTLGVLNRHIVPDPRRRSMQFDTHDYRFPVLSPGDRRAFMRSLWAPFLPEATWHGEEPRPVGTSNVYLDVSGSMDAEMPLIVTLLAQLSRHIRHPLWAFSDVVAPAVIVGGQLRTQTSGGTSMTCVLEHIAKTRPASAVVITDGYIEKVDRTLVSATKQTRLHALLSRDGGPSELRRAGIAYTQLERLPA